MFCMKCGTKLPDEAKFCFNCGFKIPSIEQEPKKVEDVVIKPSQENKESIVETAKENKSNGAIVLYNVTKEDFDFALQSFEKNSESETISTESNIYDDCIVKFKKYGDLGKPEGNFWAGQCYYRIICLLDNTLSAVDAEKKVPQVYDIIKNDALEWYTKAAEQGYSWGYLGCAALCEQELTKSYKSYREGINKEDVFAKELSYLELAIKDGNPWAMYMLARLFAVKRTLERDFDYSYDATKMIELCEHALKKEHESKWKNIDFDKIRNLCKYLSEKQDFSTFVQLLDFKYNGFIPFKATNTVQWENCDYKQPKDDILERLGQKNGNENDEMVVISGNEDNAVANSSAKKAKGFLKSFLTGAASVTSKIVSTALDEMAKTYSEKSGEYYEKLEANRGRMSEDEYEKNLERLDNSVAWAEERLANKKDNNDDF